MDIALLIIVIIQFLYIVFKDIINGKEREKLQLKLMSKDVAEYKKVVEKVEDAVSEEVSPYIPVEEASFEQIFKAKES